ncbi:hypothetical protein [Enterobacter roggenkampii]|uniref:hypothetical protein n=1 Tax=Enterobacter roggenkampii TaxID=1812935 RepID=UPI00215A1161|nr:hypothetical protein [Enterobacter roggenkampii]
MLILFFLVDFNVDLFFCASGVMLKKSGYMREKGMELDEECVNMMAHAVGRAVMELSFADLPVTQEAIIDKLEQYRKETGNVIGRGG